MHIRFYYSRTNAQKCDYYVILLISYFQNNKIRHVEKITGCQKLGERKGGCNNKWTAQESSLCVCRIVLHIDCPGGIQLYICDKTSQR